MEELAKPTQTLAWQDMQPESVSHAAATEEDYFPTHDPRATAVTANAADSAEAGEYSAYDQSDDDELSLEPHSETFATAEDYDELHYDDNPYSVLLSPKVFTLTTLIDSSAAAQAAERLYASNLGGVRFFSELNRAMPRARALQTAARLETVALAEADTEPERSPSWAEPELG